MAIRKSLLLILGDQLYPKKYIKKLNPDFIFMAEDYALCQEHRHHKQKILLYFIAMRHYAEELNNSGFKVIYKKLEKGSLISKLKTEIREKKIQTLQYFTIDDHSFRNDFDSKLSGIEKEEIHGPKFFVSKESFKDYLSGLKKPFMKTFYERTRRHFNILMTNGKPSGGKFSFDQENRKKLPKNIAIPARQKYTPSPFLNDVIKIIDKNFSEHPGSCEGFNWPYSRAQYLKAIDNFITVYMDNFGPYQDAISNREPFLFHSLISPGLNLGLITPEDVVRKIGPLLDKGYKISSVEGFLRQVIGWREFVKGIYDNYREQMEGANYWKSQRSLKSCWWNGSTGLEPVDDVIKKCLRYGYAHHIERLMIMANIFNLIGAKPNQVYNWFMEMTVDSADWVMQANVYGMGLMSEGGIFATKPYICGSNYIMKMGDYKKGEWCDVMDGLYWRFIKVNKKFFLSNPRMAMMVRLLEKMPEEKYKRIEKAAKKFIEETTES